MPAVAPKGCICTGHDCFPPRKSIEGSSNVFVNGIPVHRQGDAWESHTCMCDEVPHGSHGSVLGGGSGKVFVNGKPIGRIGDNVACGGNIVAGCSSNVFAG